MIIVGKYCRALHNTGGSCDSYTVNGSSWSFIAGCSSSPLPMGKGLEVEEGHVPSTAGLIAPWSQSQRTAGQLFRGISFEKILSSKS